MFHEVLQFAKMHVNITQGDIEVMFHSRKSLLYNNGIPWVTKEGNSFDVTGKVRCHLILSIITECFIPGDICYKRIRLGW